MNSVVDIATVVAAVGAMATATSVTYGALQLRRRPEVDVMWRFDDRIWPATEVIIVAAGGSHLITIAVTNVGDASLSDALFTLAVDPALTCRFANLKVVAHTNRQVGRPPLYVMHLTSEQLTLSVNRSYVLPVPFDVARNLDSELEGTAYLVYHVTDSRLNGSGVRLFPSWITARPATEARRAGETGFFIKKRTLHRIRAHPDDLECGPGNRVSVRKVVLQAEPR